MKFKTMTRENERFISNPGSPEKILYAGSYNKQGVLEIKENGKQDLYGYIQSFTESVNINVILSRFVNGDKAALQKRQTFYADVTTAPKTYQEFLNNILAHRAIYNSLSIQEKEQYGNNFENFIMNYSPEKPATITNNQPNTPEPDAAGINVGNLNKTELEVTPNEPKQ